MTTTLPGEPGLPDLEDSLTRIPLFTEIDRIALAQVAAHRDPIAWCLALAAVLAPPRSPVTGRRMRPPCLDSHWTPP